MKPNIQIWDIAKVTPYERNVKKHPIAQVKKIAQSIKEFGWDQPIVVDGDGIIIKGHGRRAAAEFLELKTVPVWVRDDLTAEQVRASRLADNRVAESDIDINLFKAELADLDYDLDGIFDKKELDFAVELDFGTINGDKFVDDLQEAVDAQRIATEQEQIDAKNRNVRIDKALGFRFVNNSEVRHVVAMMAKFEYETGKQGVDALVDFARSYTQKGTK